MAGRADRAEKAAPADPAAAASDPLSELGARAAEGDRAALDRLVSGAAEWVSPLCRAVLVGYVEPGEIDALCEELLVELGRPDDGVRRYDPIRPFKAWLTRRVRDACMRLLAGRKAWSPDVAAEQLEQREPPPLGALSAAELERAWSALPGRYRLLLHLRYAQGLSPDELADHLGLPVQGLVLDLTRAIRAVRRTVGPT